MGDTPVVASPQTAGGPPFAADQDAGLTYWPYAKLAWGPSGTQIEVDDVDGKRIPVKAIIGLQTSGGYSKSHTIAAAGTNATSIKASAGQVYLVRVFNNADYPVFVKFHNTNVAPTPGAGVVETIGVQAGTGIFHEFEAGDPFTTGIGMSITKGIADNDVTGVLLNDCLVDVFYK